MTREELMEIAVEVWGEDPGKPWSTSAVHHLEDFAGLVEARVRDKFWDALMSDLEHGVKSLNERASERFAKDYPALSSEFQGDN